MTPLACPVAAWTERQRFLIFREVCRGRHTTHTDVANIVEMTENMEIDSGDRIEVVRRHSLTALVRDEVPRVR